MESFNSNMNLILFTLAIAIALVLERALHAFSYTFMYLTCRLALAEKPKAVLSLQVSSSALNSVVSIFAAALSVLVQTVAIMIQWILTVMAMLLISIVLYVIFQYANDIMFEAGMTYNRSIGPSVQVLFVWPLQFFTWFFESLCPIWNAFIWFWKKLPPQLLIETLTNSETMGFVQNAVASFGEMIVALAMSLISWVQSFTCCKAGQFGDCNPRCFDAGERVFDLLSPMAHLRNLVVWFMQWLRTMCTVITPPLDLATYPLMDINFAKGVHFIGNSIIYFFFHIPAVTVERCNQFRAEGAIMCVPDFEPVFNMMTSGFHYMGLFVDNWLDVVILIVEEALGRPTPPCKKVPDLLRDFDYKANTFGTNETLIVGMTEYMFARTDGLSVQYFSLDRDWQTMIHRDAFPFDVNLAYGVAAISHFPDADHDPKGDDTTSLLGCSCAYTSVGVQFTCGVAMFTDTVAAEQRTIGVKFQLPSTGQVLSCNKVMVRVESVRWPVSRFTATRVQRVDGSYAQDVGCASKGTCLMADAAIWIRPMCSVDSIDLACVESFKQASCFPYCMALHVRGSGTQSLVLYDADEWNGGVTMLKRDCGLYNMQPGSNTTGISVSLPNSVYDLSATAPADSACIQNPQTISRVPRSTMVEYAAHASMELEGQPFLFANDLALTAVRGQVGLDGLPSWSIKVQRIYGNQANEFTMIPLNQNIPSMGPCTTPSKCDNVVAQCQTASGCKAAIPYGYDHNANAHVLGTTSQRFLFWVTNPSLEPFYAFSAYCKNRNTTKTNKLQISVISSYGGIRLWRMDPYIYCPEIDGVRECPEQQSVSTKTVSSLDFTDFDEALCDVPFNVMAVDLDYINEDNLALTVLRTTLANVDIYTLRPIDLSIAEYVVVWVNPNTLEQRNDTLWMPEAASPALAQGFLCPSQRRMPNLGSLVAEAANSIVFFVQLPINLLLSFPVILDLTGGKCPLLNRGHSVLKTCGSELLSLEDFFTSIYRCNTLFWMAFDIVADSFGPGTPQNFINAASTIAENSDAIAMLPGVASSLSFAGRVDPAAISSMLMKNVANMPIPIHAANLAMKNPISSVHFYYRLGSRMLMQILEATQGSRTVANIFWNVVSDGAKDYDDMVLQRMRRTCAGFAMLAGFNTPLGRLTHRWCTGWVEMQKGFHTMASVFFVDVPLMDCVCVKSTGAKFSSFVKEKCWPDAPDLQKPMLNALMTMDKKEACPDIVKMTQTHFTESMDEMFSLMQAGTRELSSVMDYFIQSNYVGDCNNYADNPYVLTLIPQPADYFRVCGKTQTCRNRCLSEFQAFEAKNLEVPVTETVTENVQSLFFNSVDDDTYMPLRPIAMLELYDCNYPCGYVQTVGPYSDRCFLLGGENGAGQLQVLSFCVPIQLGSNVRRGKQSWTVENLVPGALQAGFVFDLNPINFWESFRLLVHTESALYICHTSCIKLADAESFGAVRIKRFVILGNQVVVEALKLDGVGTFTTTTASYCFRFAAYGMTTILPCTSNVWEGTGRPVCVQDVSNLCGKVLVLPGTSAEQIRTCERVQGNYRDCTTYMTRNDFLYKSSLTSAGLVSQSAVIQGDPNVWHILMTAPPDQVSHWLMMSKVSIDPLGGAQGSSGAGMPAQLKVDVKRQCSLDNCVGCQDLGLQRLCYAASQCQVARCIGTMVHQRRPLCSIGMYLSAAVRNQLSFTEGAWLIVSETMVSVLAMSGGVDPPQTIAWPDQAFYGYICSAKDVTATGISIVTSSINGVIQSVAESPVAQSYQPAISNNAFILFTMTMAATTNFLHQMALFPLYGLIATQKIFVCNANSILAVVGGDKMSVTLGDPEIQDASAKATGKCMSQYFAESSQGEGSGTNNKGSMVAGAVSEIVTAFSAMRLEKLVHPIDAMLTWMQGCISGLQDVVQTIDRNR